MTPDFIKTEMDIQVSGASQIPTDEFKPEVNFIDLHLDFPASFEPYKMGHTPFMRAVSLIGHKNMQEHSFRVNYLNDVHNREKEIKEIFTLYNSRNALLFKDKKNHFKDKVLAFLDEDLECDTDLDNNRALYLAIEKAFLPFSEPQKNVDTVHLFTKKLIELEKNNKEELHEFINTIIDNGFLRNIQTDCLEIYPKIIDHELSLRPALFLDHLDKYDSNIISYRVSAHEFKDVKDLYKDIIEISSRALILIAGINNIIKRNSFNEFKDNKPKSLDEYADIPVGFKLQHIDDSWYSFDGLDLDNQLRNSIAHYKTEYNDITQELTYYPKREGMAQKKSESMYFLDFTRKILQSFRELHRLNHLTKCLYVYYYMRILDIKGTPFDI